MAVVKEIEVDEPVCGKNRIAFDEHAVKRMKERRVTENQVLATLKSPDISGLPADPGHCRVRRHYGSHTSIDVVYEEQKTRIVAISALRVARKN